MPNSGGFQMSSLLALVEIKIENPKQPQKSIGVEHRNQSVQTLCFFQPIKVAIEENQIKWPIVASLDCIFPRFALIAHFPLCVLIGLFGYLRLFLKQLGQIRQNRFGSAAKKRTFQFRPSEPKGEQITLTATGKVL